MEVCTTILRTCKSCSNNQPLSEFHKDKKQKWGLSLYCKTCRNASRRKYYVATREQTLKKTFTWEQANPDKRKHYQLIRQYGISLDDYNNMLIDQKGLCQVCHKPELSTRKKTLSVDHNHSTGEVRGLLCDNCNKSLGLLKDDIAILESMITYLKKYQHG